MKKNNKETPLEIGGVKLYTVKDIAGAMGVEEQTVRRYIKRGFLKSKKIGRNIFITEAQLKEFIEANKQLNFHKDYITEVEKHRYNSMEKDKKKPTIEELKDMAKEKGLEGYSNMKKEELIELLLKGAE